MEMIVSMIIWKGSCKMRFGEKGALINSVKRNEFGVDFHNRLEKDGQMALYELASEYGVQAHEVKKIKKQISRS